MNNTTHNTALEINLLRTLALMQYNGTDFFILGITAYEGTEPETREQYSIDRQFNIEPVTFAEWCADNCIEVEPMNGDDYNNNYFVLTDSEADEKCGEYIKDSLWAFNASFLSSETGIDIEVFEAIQANGKCESNNSAIESTIDDIDSFIESAISADGRGHFMNTYDGEEGEETIEGTTFYIYRIN